MSKRLANKVALITGAGGAIGRAVAVRFAREGAKVAVADLDEAAAKETVQIIQKEGGVAEAARVDVANEADVRRWIDGVAAQWGVIDVLVNNAAAFVFGTIEQTSEADWDRVLGVNVKGYAFCARHVLPHLKHAGGGAIVNMASVSSVVAQPEFVPYNTSKGAILQLTRCLAMDLGPFNIRVNAVLPGTIDTPATDKHALKLGTTREALTASAVAQHFIKRLGTVEDVANACLFLASDESSFITATPLLVDGGYTSH